MTNERRPFPRWPSDIARDVDDEIATHLEQLRDEYVERGLSIDEAAAAAARKFGEREAVAGICRHIDRTAVLQERRRHMLTDLRQDLAHALRLFGCSRGFAVTAIVTLALGIGATTAIFTLANWTLFRPVPGVASPANVSVFWVGRRGDRSFTPSYLSYPNLADAAARLSTISLGAYQAGGRLSVGGGGQAARTVSAEFADSGYFEVLGVRMQIGRPFTRAEDTPPSPFLGAVISDRLWRSMFQRRPDVLRQTIDIAGVRFAILGVAPPGFHGTQRLSFTDLWVPGAATPLVRHMNVRYDGRARGGFYELVARLKPGATWAGAQAEFESLRAWLRDEYPQDNGKFQQVGFHRMGPIGPPPYGGELFTRVVAIAAGAGSALVLLIACANVAGLLLVRGIARRGEIGVRKALGASRWRLVRQQLAEGVVLWTAGGAVAVGAIVLLARTMNAGALFGLRGLDLDLSIDWHVMAFSAAVSLVVGVLCSIEPALRATRVEPVAMLRAAGTAVTSRSPVGTSLAVVQLAASLTLLIGAYLLAGTLVHLWRVPLGFDASHLYVMPLEPGSVGYGEAASLAYVNEFQRRLAGLPGVQRIAAAAGAPFFGGANMTWNVRAAGTGGDTPPIEVRSNALFSTAYFETTGIPIVEGRSFSDAEIEAGRRGESRVVVVSQNLARHLFGSVSAVGRAIEFPRQRRGGEQYVIVGVAGTARYTDLTAPADELFYEPAGPRGITSGATLIVRTDGRMPLAGSARMVAAALNPTLPLTAVLSMSDAVARVRSEWDSLALILGVLSTIATLLACVGLYGVVAHAVAERRREVGIRIALGATHAHVRTLVLRRAGVMTGAGAALGLAGGWAFTRAISSRLVGVSPYDPLAWSLAALSLVAIATFASIGPARAATRVDVNETLRSV